MIINLPAGADTRRNVTSYFTDMPQVLIPTLESSYRVELVENYFKVPASNDAQTSSRNDSLQNNFGTTVKLLAIDTLRQHIYVEITSNARFEMKIFEQADGDALIGIINTVCAPICSSYIKFYNINWESVSINVPHLSVDNWIKDKNAMVDGASITDILKVSFIELRFAETKEAFIEAYNRSLDFLSVDKVKLLMPYIEDKVIIMHRNGAGFNL